jgi:hypothetical protein
LKAALDRPYAVSIGRFDSAAFRFCGALAAGGTSDLGLQDVRRRVRCKPRDYRAQLVFERAEFETNESSPDPEGQGGQPPR